MRRRPSRRGAAMVEMAVMLPVVALLLMGMLEASRMCVTTQLLTNAAREGCRVASAQGKTSQDVTSRIDATLTAAGITPALVTRTLSPPSIETTVLNAQITLTLSVNFSDVNWFSSPFFFKNTTVSASAAMLSQRP